MPRYDMYWSQETHYGPISSTLFLKRQKKENFPKRFFTGC